MGKRLQGVCHGFRVARFWVGATVYMRQAWHTRVVTDADTFEEVKAWTDQMKADGWDDFAAFGNRLYLRRFEPRWPYPAARQPAGADAAEGREA